MTGKKIIFFLPLLLFVCLMGMALASLFYGGFYRGDAVVFPEQSAPSFSRTEFSSADLTGRVTLVNFFASWCPPCEAEHHLLMDLKMNYGVTIYGIDYKDSDSGRVDYLQRLGNPYAAITTDPDGEIAGLWKIHGVPETFVIDKDGIIRYRISAPITPEDIKNTLIPLIRRIQ